MPRAKGQKNRTMHAHTAYRLKLLRDGMSVGEVAGIMRVSKQAIYDLRRRYPDLATPVLCEENQRRQCTIFLADQIDDVAASNS